MSDNSSKLPWSVINCGGKIALSLLVLYVLFESIQVIPLIAKWARGVGGVPTTVAPTASPGYTREVVIPLWPRFPGSSDAASHQNVINGVRFITQDLVVSGSAGDVLEFYRSVMSARGWFDATEEFYGIQPYMRDESEGMNSLQDPHYLELYLEMMDSNLVMRKDDWSLYVLTVPARNGRGRLDVRICAASTPSVKEFYAVLADKFAEKKPGKSDGAIVESSETSGGNTFHTKWSRAGEPPGLVFEGMLKNLLADDWRPIALSPQNEDDTGEYVALLVNRGGYSCVRVAPSVDGIGSSVIMTEVIEDDSR